MEQVPRKQSNEVSGKKLRNEKVQTFLLTSSGCFSGSSFHSQLFFVAFIQPLYTFLDPTPMLSFELYLSTVFMPCRHLPALHHRRCGRHSDCKQHSLLVTDFHLEHVIATTYNNQKWYLHPLLATAYDKQKWCLHPVIGDYIS